MAEANRRLQSGDPEFLPLPDGVIDDSSIFHIVETSGTSSAPGRRTLCFRHVWFGTADNASIDDFIKWADVAGSCIAARPASRRPLGNRYLWIEYISSIAIQWVVGSPFRTRKWLVNPLEHWNPTDAASWLMLPASAFLASVQAIDTILAQPLTVFGYPAPDDSARSAVEAPALVAAIQTPITGSMKAITRALGYSKGYVGIAEEMRDAGEIFLVSDDDGTTWSMIYKDPKEHAKAEQRLQGHLVPRTYKARRKHKSASKPPSETV